MGDQISQTSKNATSEKARRQSGANGDALSGQKAETQRVKVRDILGSVQAKLTVGQANDEYEKEADNVADEVMRMSDANIQRNKKAEDEQDEEIQRMPIGSRISPLSTLSTAPADRHQFE